MHPMSNLVNVALTVSLLHAVILILTLIDLYVISFISILYISTLYLPLSVSIYLNFFKTHVVHLFSLLLFLELQAKPKKKYLYNVERNHQKSKTK